MKMRLRLLFMFFLLVLSAISVSAYDKVYDGYVFALEPFTVGSDSFYIRGVNNYQTVMFVQNNDSAFYAENNTCTDETYFQFCYYGAKIDYITYGRRIPDTLDWEPSINIQIYSKKPTITVSRVVASKINYDETVKIRVEIENTGSLAVTDVVYKDFLPTNVLIKSFGDDVSLKNNAIYWSIPRLSPDVKITLEYELRPADYSSIKLGEGNLSYNYESLSFSQKPANSTIAINAPFSLQTSFNKQTVGIEDEVTYSFKLTNDDWNDNLEVDFSFLAPKRITIISVSEELDKSDIKYSFVLEPSQSKDLFVKFKSGFSGDYKIKAHTSMSIRDETYEDDDELNFTVALDGLIPVVDLSVLELFEDEEFNLTITISNPSDEHFSSFVAIIESLLFDTISLNEDLISAGKSKTLFNQTMKTKKLDEEKNYSITLRGQYRSKTSEAFNFEKTVFLNVKPVIKDFKITKILSKEKVVPGEEITVNVSVKNLGSSSSTLIIHDENPSNFRVISPLPDQKTITLDEDEESYIYHYTLLIPENTALGTYTLKTIVSYDDLGEQVAEKKLEVMDEKEIEDSNTESNEESEEKGFFQKIIIFFKEFFKL